MRFRIRFNKSRGQPGRGTVDHVWRVFAGEKEYLAKQIVLKTICHSEKEEKSEDWNIVCEGDMTIDRETSTITIDAHVE